MDSSLPTRAPRCIPALGLLFLLSSVFVTPRVLIKLGPMRQSLTSEIASVKVLAEGEVLVGRLVCVTAGIALLVIALVWRRFVNLEVIQRLAQPQDVAAGERILGGRVLNLSFGLIMAVFVVGPLSAIAVGRYAPMAAVNCLYGEDGIVEYATAALFLAAALFAVRVARRAGGDWKVAHWFLAVLFLVCVGEELSWGQRILGLQTSPKVAAINVQDEYNLHNMLGYAADHLFTLAILGYGVFLPILKGMHPFWANLFDRLGLPIPSRGLAAGFLVASFTQPWVFYRFFAPGPEAAYFQELRELMSAAGLLLLMRESAVRERKRLLPA